MAMLLRVVYAMAWLYQRVMKALRRRDYMMSTDGIYLAAVFSELDNSKARRELQWTPRPLAETVRDTVAWFASREKGC